MKVILSRRGLIPKTGEFPAQSSRMNTGVGGIIPSPIPRENSGVRYSDLTLFDDYNVSDFLKDVPFKSKGAETCHLDPDIHQPYLHNRSLGWHRAFGQSELPRII